MISVTYDLADLDFEKSELLAGFTSELGLQNCFERAKAAIAAAPSDWPLHYVEGELSADQGMEPLGHGEHGWLLWCPPDYSVVAVIDPTVVAFFEAHGVPGGLAWTLTD